MENTDYIALALHPLVEQGVISHGRVAEMLGRATSEIINLYGQHGYPFYDMSEDELLKDVLAAGGETKTEQGQTELIPTICNTCGREYLFEPCQYCSIKKCLEGYDHNLITEILQR